MKKSEKNSGIVRRQTIKNSKEIALKSEEKHNFSEKMYANRLT